MFEKQELVVFIYFCDNVSSCKLFECLLMIRVVDLTKIKHWLLFLVNRHELNFKSVSLRDCQITIIGSKAERVGLFQIFITHSVHSILNGQHHVI